MKRIKTNKKIDKKKRFQVQQSCIQVFLSFLLENEIIFSNKIIFLQKRNEELRCNIIQTYIYIYILSTFVYYFIYY